MLALRWIGLLLAGIAALGARAGEAQREIEHLLQYVQASGCEFIRNGKAHDASAARAHLTKKYQAVKSRVHSAEDFIRYVASASSISKQTYRVRCAGAAETDSGPWLERELSRLRGS